MDFLDDQPSAPAILPTSPWSTDARSFTGTSSFRSTAIPAASAVERMGIEKAPVAAFAPKTPAAVAFRDLWTEIAGRLWPSR